MIWYGIGAIIGCIIVLLFDRIIDKNILRLKNYLNDR